MFGVAACSGEPREAVPGGAPGRIVLEFPIPLRVIAPLAPGPARIAGGGSAVRAPRMAALPEVKPRDAIRALALQPDGKILAAGSAFNGKDDEGILRRFFPGGESDAAFGGAAGIRVSFADEDHDQLLAVGVQTTGRVVAAGVSSLGGRSFFAMAGFTAEGVLDESFGTKGKVVTEIQTNRDAARCLAIQADDGILLAGSSSDDRDGDHNDFAIARYTRNGQLDSTFGNEGKVTVDFDGGDDVANCMALQSDGKFLVAGGSAVDGKSVVALARFEPGGKRDFSFGKRGKVIAAVEGRKAYASGIALTNRGQIFVAGAAFEAGTREAILLGFEANGAEDKSFGTDGRSITRAGVSIDANALAIQKDGKLIVAGAATDGRHYGICVLRFLSSGRADQTWTRRSGRKDGRGCQARPPMRSDLQSPWNRKERS